MIIQGVKTIKTSTIQKITVELDQEATNGICVCDILLDEEKGHFTAVLSTGEAYTFQSTEKPFLPFLIRELEANDQWLYYQLRDVRLDGLVDIEKTVESLLMYIQETDEYKHQPSDFIAIKEMKKELFEEFETHAPMYIHTLWENWDKWIHPYREDGLLPNATTIHDENISIFQLEGDQRCHVFCEQIAPLLANVLKQNQPFVL